MIPVEIEPKVRALEHMLSEVQVPADQCIAASPVRPLADSPATPSLEEHRRLESIWYDAVSVARHAGSDYRAALRAYNRAQKSAGKSPLHFILHPSSVSLPLPAASTETDTTCS